MPQMAAARVTRWVSERLPSLLPFGTMTTGCCNVSFFSGNGDTTIIMPHLPKMFLKFGLWWMEYSSGQMYFARMKHIFHRTKNTSAGLLTSLIDWWKLHAISFKGARSVVKLFFQTPSLWQVDKCPRSCNGCLFARRCCRHLARCHHSLKWFVHLFFVLPS